MGNECSVPAISMLYILTALLTGYAAAYQMMQTVNGGPWSWCYPFMLGASILLLVSGIHVAAAAVNVVRLSVIAAAVPLAVCAVFGRLPMRCWLFALAVGIAAWVCFTLASGTRRNGVPAFISSVVLVASWLPGSVAAVHAYLFPSPPAVNPPGLVPLIILWAFILAVSLMSGAAYFRPAQN